MGNYGFNDKASSFRCGTNVFAYFCDNNTNADTLNECLNGRGATSAGRISNPNMRNDKLSDLILVPYDEKK